MSSLSNKPFGIIYNFPTEFNAIAAELWRRDIPLTFIDPEHLVLDPSEGDLKYSLILNDLSAPPGFPFQNEFTQALMVYNRHLETNQYRFSQGRIINGSSAVDVFTNRARQISLFASLNVRYPRTILANNAETLVRQSPSLKFPVLIKGNNVAKQNVVLKFDSIEALIDGIFAGNIIADNGFVLAQEYHEPKADHIVRVNTLNGKFLSAQKVYTLREPSLSWEAELASEPFEPGIDIIQAVEHIAREGRVDLGSVEYFTNRKTNDVYFYNITPFNYARKHDPDGVDITAIGDYAERRLSKIREFELAL